MNLDLRSKKAFTLIEILIVMTIIIVMAALLTGSLDPAALTNKAFDAKQKKDIARIKVAFEEYMNDTGCYPDYELVAELMDADNCKTGVFSPWLSDWICDPIGQPYKIAIEEGVCGLPGGCSNITPVACPSWFKVMTQLRNKQDGDIPVGWYGDDALVNVYSVGGEYTTEDVNYGKSSTNINWYDVATSSRCSVDEDECYTGMAPTCGSAKDAPGCAPGDPFPCYKHSDCLPECVVLCCGGGGCER